MVREIGDKNVEKKIIDKYPQLSPKFIFLHPAYNFRNNEVGAVIGLSQLKSLDKNNKLRTKNFKTYLNILLTLYRNYCFAQSGKEKEFTKEIGDKVQFFYRKGYFMAYMMGVAEVCKSVIFTQEKIDELNLKNHDFF